MSQESNGTFEVKSTQKGFSDYILNPFYTLKHNWQNGTAGKVGTVGGLASGAIAGGLAGPLVGTVSMGATIGSLIFPGIGTTIGGTIGLGVGIFIGAVPGAVIGSTAGHKFDIKKETPEVFDHGLLNSENISNLDISLDSPNPNNIKIQKEVVKEENTKKTENITIVEEKNEQLVDLVILSVESEKKTDFLKKLKSLDPNLSNKHGKHLMDVTPSKLRTQIKKSEAEELVSQLKDFGTFDIVE